MAVSERQKMLAGELYDPMDGELVAARRRARELCQDLNASREAEQDLRRKLLCELFGRGGDSVWMQPPFFCDYGSNIELGERVFFNFNCVVLDVCKISVGSFTLFGPSVQILTPLHPLDAELRRREEYGKPVTIGSDVWGRRGCDHPAGRCDRRPRRDRRRQRRHPRRAGEHLCRRQSLPRHPRDRGVVETSVGSCVSLKSHGYPPWGLAALLP
jgi:maltose O-acetyltransferase